MQLTEFQIGVIERMRKAKLDWVAEATEREWKAGNTYYIDSRCKCSKQLRKDFEKGDEMSGTQRGKLAEDLQDLALSAAWKSAYLDHRHGSGCGDQGHADSVKHANKVLKAVRQAFGFTYPERGAINV